MFRKVNKNAANIVRMVDVSSRCRDVVKFVEIVDGKLLVVLSTKVGFFLQPEDADWFVPMVESLNLGYTTVEPMSVMQAMTKIICDEDE